MATTLEIKAKTKLETQVQIVRNAYSEGYDDTQISKITKLPLVKINELTEVIKSEKQRRAEFREWVTPNIKAEFINGEIIIHLPVKVKHWRITTLLSRLMSLYVDLRDLGTVGTEKVMIALENNDYEPDLVYFSADKSIHFSDEQVICPVPDLAVEILSKKTASVDKGIKKIDYAANGIAEYWIIDPVKEQIEQYILLSMDDTVYMPAKIFKKHEEIESKSISGFVIPVNAIFDKLANAEAIKDLIKKS